MSSHQRHTTERLFDEYRRGRARRIRNQLVERHLELADDLSRRYAGRGVDRDDLRQVAAMGLVHAVERFNPDRGVPFRAFARATITGELKRHFRDHGWSVRPPRAVQETYLRVRAAREALTQELSGAPSTRALARAAGVPERAVADAEAASGALVADALVETSLSGMEERGFRRVEDRDAVASLFRTLSPRDRRVVHLRYWKGFSQREIAADIGLSQMQISRILRSSVDRLIVAARAA